MKNIKKSFATPSNKPVDVQYRLKRANESLAALEMFVQAIDPACFPEVHADILSQIGSLSSSLLSATNAAPAKKARGKKASAEEQAKAVA
jgi:hypothetical protein